MRLGTAVVDACCAEQMETNNNVARPRTMVVGKRRIISPLWNLATEVVGPEKSALLGSVARSERVERSRPANVSADNKCLLAHTSKVPRRRCPHTIYPSKDSSA